MYRPLSTKPYQGRIAACGMFRHDGARLANNGKWWSRLWRKVSQDPVGVGTEGTRRTTTQVRHKRPIEIRYVLWQPMKAVRCVRVCLRAWGMKSKKKSA